MAGSALEIYTPEKQREVLALLGISGQANHIQLLFQLGEKYQLDILTKEISLIPGKGPFIGVWGRLHIAHRSGKLDGLEMDDEWETDKHYCARIIVWRKDMGRPAAKVIGRVGKHEGSTKDGKFTPKEWPLEIARARGLRAGLGFAFSIHDAYDTRDEDDDLWVTPPDERVDANGTIHQAAVVTDEEVSTPAPAAKKQRRVNRKTGEVVDVPPEPGASGGQVNRPEPDSTREASAEADRTATTPTRGAATTSKGPDPAPAPDTNEPATINVGGHTIAQKVAIAARKAGIDDDQTRHDVIRTASRGTWTRGSDIPEDGYDPDLLDRVFDAFDGLANGTVKLSFTPDGTAQLFKVRR